MDGLTHLKNSSILMIEILYKHLYWTFELQKYMDGIIGIGDSECTRIHADNDDYQERKKDPDKQIQDTITILKEHLCILESKISVTTDLFIKQMLWAKESNVKTLIRYWEGKIR